MNYTRKLARVFCLLWCLLVLLAASEAKAAGNAVIPITPEGVEDLVKANNCPIIITIMSSRCGACRQELPSYQKIYERYGEQGLGIFVVSIDFGSSREIQAIVDRMGLTYPVFWGGERAMYAFNISLVPYKMVALNGRVVETIVGAWTPSEMESKIQGFAEACGRQ